MPAWGWGWKIFAQGGDRLNCLCASNTQLKARFSGHPFWYGTNGRCSCPDCTVFVLCRSYLEMEQEKLEKLVQGEVEPTEMVDNSSLIKEG